MRVQQILAMKPSFDVVTVTPDNKLGEVINVLATKKIGAVVVSADGTSVVGILSERDVVRELAKRGVACETLPVSEVMTADPVTCDPGEDSDEVFRLMTEGRFRHLPVVKDGAMVGLISIGDVVKAQLAELAMEKSALEGMIMGH
ncbi:MAG: CBS domain-containing protein [Pseudomonadota bacterium]